MQADLFEKYVEMCKDGFVTKASLEQNISKVAICRTVLIQC